MRVYLLQGEQVDRTLLGVKTDRDPLDGTYVVHRTLLVKIGKGDMPGLLVDRDRRDRRRHFLDQRQSVLPVLLVCHIDHFFQKGASEASGIPCRHILSLLTI